MYYEAVRPGAKPRYVEVDPRVVGERHRVAVLELAKRRSWWRVWVDGRPVSRPIFFPGSHGAWQAQVVAESWNSGTGVCNRFSYRFERISLATRPGGSWSRLAGAQLFSDPATAPSAGRRARSSPPPSGNERDRGGLPAAPDGESCTLVPSCAGRSRSR